MSITNINGVKLKNSLKRFVKVSTFVEDVASKIKSIPDITTQRGQLELISLVCSCVEDKYPNNKDGSIDKKALVIQILGKIFPDLTEEERDAIANHVDFLCENGLVKAVPLAEKLVSYVGSWLLKKTS